MADTCDSRPAHRVPARFYGTPTHYPSLHSVARDYVQMGSKHTDGYESVRGNGTI